MRKLFAILLFIVFAAPVFAAIATPEQLKIYQERLAAATNDLQRGDEQANIDIYGGDDPQSFDEIVTRTKAAFAKHNYVNDKYAISKACQIACWSYNGKFGADAYKVARADNNFFVYYLARTHRQALGLTDDECFDIYSAALLRDGAFLSMDDVRSAVDDLIKLAPMVDEAKAKTTLKKLNRLYSPRLIKDKASWEPVVAMIRTALDTY